MCRASLRQAQYDVSRPALLTDERTSRRLGKIRQSNTRAEQLVRRALFATGLRYRASNRDLPGSPDVANRSRNWAVFVHGCFWHGHAGCPRATVPKRNREFWVAKFTANRRRDARVRRQLRALGYTVFVVWECEALDANRLQRRARAISRQLSESAV